MKFCRQCDNMYYIRINGENEEEESVEDNSLIYYCRNCGNKETNIMDTICISDSQVKSEEKMLNYVNEYTKYDPTLPRVDNVPCPNTECITHKDGKLDKEVIYVRYDDINLKFIYVCPHCEHVWKIKE